jgi:hypothetical protein
MTRIVPFALVGAASLLVAVPAHADRRAFTHTYEYMTMPESETELEIYNTQSRTVLDGASDKGFVLELEIEHGITSHWDVALYQVFEQERGADPADDVAMHYAETKLETRYRLAERGEWPIDLELYGEGVKFFGEGSYEAEAKVILARDFGSLTVATNLIGEVGFGAAFPEAELELGWAAGITYELSPDLKIGAESWGAFEAEEVDESLEGYAGPAISWAPATSLWVALTPGFGFTDAADDVVVRLAVGLHIQ